MVPEGEKDLIEVLMCLREYLSGPRESNLVMNKKKECKFKRRPGNSHHGTN